MSDAPDNLLLAYMRRLDEKLDRVLEMQADQGRRLTLLEIAVSNLAASEMGHYANFSLRADRIETRLDRIDRRLGLIEV
ncbi:hypothetical protein [Acidisoma sp. 7E03]